MGPNLLLLLLLGLAGQGSAGSLPEELQARVGSSIRVHCHYRPQDGRARKVWCRFLPEGCQPLVSSAVDRRAPGHSRTFLTDMGSGLLQVEMTSLREEDAGEYGCVVETATGSQTVHRVALKVLPAEGEEEFYKVASETDAPSSDPLGSASPLEPSQHEKSIPFIWGSVLLLSLLVVAVALLAVVARRKGNRRGVPGQSHSSRGPGMALSSVVHTDDSGLAVGVPSNVPHIRLDSPPSFDSTTYSNLSLEPPSRKPPAPAPSSSPPLPPKVLSCSKPVTYATVIFPGGDRGGEPSQEPAQDPPQGQAPPS
ncbi:LOW QUALITY PROTEIN: trem-like transcript 1 protein [Myotis lucifugus]|uniref:LOW QUALITY PROTEIN: trem-like transcript 1 protein n=1 Tax=Myotis lucifugus TaxID=59463 RepID=UPI0003C45B9E|nr:LOW QUALITY PROTEIN: trem-like transcript 1 protein [Myotis lucifugus]